MADARVRVSLVDGTLEFEGSETFVSTQLERFSESIQSALTAARTKPSTKPAPSTGDAADTPDPLESSEYDDVFGYTEDKGLQILKDLPGANNADKTQSAAKLLLYGLQAMKKKDTVYFEEVKAICKDHGCYNSANMAAYLKQDRESFVFGGAGRKQTLKLTVPGRKAAKTLIENLRSGSAE